MFIIGLQRIKARILAMYYFFHPLFDIKQPFHTQILGTISIKPRYNKKSNLKISIDGKCVINKGLCIQGCGELKLSNGVNLNDNCYVIVNDSILIGRNTIIAPHVAMIDTSHNFKDPQIPIKSQGSTTKPISIGENVWIGRGATILMGVTIGSGSIIAAGSVVNKDSAPNSIVGGVPSKFLTFRNA